MLDQGQPNLPWRLPPPEKGKPKIVFFSISGLLSGGEVGHPPPTGEKKTNAGMNGIQHIKMS